MTKYYSNQPDFSTEAPDPAYNYFSSMSDIMDNIEAAGNTVKSEGVEDLYTQKGEAALGVKKDSSIFDKSIQRIYSMLNSAKKVHSDIMQNIDNKFTRGMDDAFKSLNNVNGDKKPYESKYTKKDTIKYKQEAGANGFEQRAYNDPQPYKLHELLDGKASPIEAAKDVYETRLQAAKAYLAQKDKLTDKEIKNLEGKSAEDIVEAYFPSKIPDYQGLKASRFQEENKDTLQKVDIGLKVLAGLAAAGGIIFAPFTSGASLTLTYASGAYLFADNAYSAWTGQTMITGDRLSTEDRVWAGIDAATTLASMGSLAYLTKFGTSGPNLLKNLATLGKYADDANDVSKVFYTVATDQDSSTALQNLVIGQVTSFGVGKAGNYFGGKFSRGGTPDLDVDLPGGSRPAGDFDVSSKVGQLPKLDPANVRLSSRPDLHLKASPADGTLAKLKTHPPVSVDLPKMKQISGDGAVKAVSEVKPGDVDVPKVKGVRDVEAPKVNKEQILRNIEESRLARESSNFDQYLAKESLIKYPTLLDSKVKIVDKAKLPNWIGESFTDSNYRTVITTEEITLYRTFGGYSDAGGGFVTTTPASNRIQAKIDTALLPEWKNTRQYEAVIKIPKGVELNIGKVAPQTINSSGFILKGGADQVLLPNPWPLDWIVDIRVVPN